MGHHVFFFSFEQFDTQGISYKFIGEYKMRIVRHGFGTIFKPTKGHFTMQFVTGDIKKTPGSLE